MSKARAFDNALQRVDRARALAEKALLGKAPPPGAEF